MTNKPAPTAPSAYIGDSFGPLRAFVAKYSAAANLCSSTPTRAWISGIIESICIVFRTRVQSLIDTVKSMDAALNKRSGRPKVANSSGMSDSDKILLQLLLDVQAFASMAVAMDVPIESIPSYTALLHEVQEGAPTFTNVIE